jgi:PilZ domain
MGAQRSRATRVRFDMGYPARIMAIDGTWFRNCHLENVSQTGAKVTVEGSVEGLNLSEFFLALSRTGNAHRRCRMVWLTGDTMGVRFELSKPASDRAGPMARRFEHDGA